MTEITIYTDTMEQTTVLFGPYDANMKLVEEAFAVTVSAKDSDRAGGNAVIIKGEDGETVKSASEAVKSLLEMVRLGNTVDDQKVRYIIDMIRDGKSEELSGFHNDPICITVKGKPINAKTLGQKQYVDAMRENTVVLGVGPAGTGKTFLAVAMAVTALRNKEVERIILTRPAVEAGEKLGFLPGELQNKIDPYLTPLRDALYEMLGAEKYQQYVEKGIIEIAPLAYMRGRTLNNSYIILDEAQNTTKEQMKMFLTRLGFGSHAVVTGDLTQTDLPLGKKSGLGEAVDILKNIEGIAVHRFTGRDVVRHRLVQKIIEAYEKHDRKEEKIRAERDTRKKFTISAKERHGQNG